MIEEYNKLVARIEDLNSKLPNKLVSEEELVEEAGEIGLEVTRLIEEGVI